MNIVGHKKIIKLLERAINNHKISQAYLFIGPEQVGKFSVALKLAKNLILGENFSTWSGNDSRELPDLIAVRPEKEEVRGQIRRKDISVEQVREAQKQLNLFPLEGKFKVLVVDESVRMSAAAQNALLKTLEEPNSTSAVILVASGGNRILPTIKSRCQKITFSLVATQEIISWLATRKSDQAEKIALFSMGKPGMAEAILADPEELFRQEKWQQHFQELMDWGINQRLELAEVMSRDIPQTEKILEFWIWLSHSRILASGREEQGKNLQILENLERELDLIKNTNANKRLILENLLINF